ncbi:MAG: hypothetical protein CM1200mP16_07390 [Nitrospina sp.]|nr:MAG: hypothetical protein CM1200mP16_07390 [Nitrospina sp.]
MLSESPNRSGNWRSKRGNTRSSRQSEQRLIKKFKIFIKEKMPEAADILKVEEEKNGDPDRNGQHGGNRSSC